MSFRDKTFADYLKSEKLPMMFGGVLNAFFLLLFVGAIFMGYRSDNEYPFASVYAVVIVFLILKSAIHGRNFYAYKQGQRIYEMSNSEDRMVFEKIKLRFTHHDSFKADFKKKFGNLEKGKINFYNFYLADIVLSHEKIAFLGLVNEFGGTFYLPPQVFSIANPVAEKSVLSSEIVNGQVKLELQDSEYPQSFFVIIRDPKNDLQKWFSTKSKNENLQ